MWQTLIGDIRQQQAFLDMLSSSWTADYTASGGRIFCGRGCRGCCSLVVNTTLTEAVAVAGTLTQRQGEAVRSHVARLKGEMGGVGGMKEYLRMHRREMGFCPFLEEDGACGVYGVRPLSCRALLSTRESRWCEVDFAALTSLEKENFVASLDRSAVAFPMHYVASMQEAGQEMEVVASRRMAGAFGFSLYGSLPVLVHLVLDHRLAEACAEGYDAAASVISGAGVDHPFLLHMER